MVEDDSNTRSMLRSLLEKDGWTVAEAVNGADALSQIVHQQPALILLDLLMPDMDGFAFVAEMRQHQDWQSIPVIVITAKGPDPRGPGVSKRLAAAQRLHDPGVSEGKLPQRRVAPRGPHAGRSPDVSRTTR